MKAARASLGANLGQISYPLRIIFAAILCATFAAAQEAAADKAAEGDKAHAPAQAKPAPTASPTPKNVARLFATLGGPKKAEVVKAPVKPLPAYVETEESARLEQRVFALVNELRAANGMAPFVWDEGAAKIARAHSTNMAQNGFLNHIDPQGRDAGARARELGVRGWRALGENIAYNKGYDQPADFAVERWSKSFGHRDNILTTAFTRTGIGVAVASDGRIYFTQTFLAR